MRQSSHRRRTLPGNLEVGTGRTAPREVTPRAVQLLSPRTPHPHEWVCTQSLAASARVDAVEVVQRIVITLASPEAFHAVAMKLFCSHGTRVGQDDVESSLPTDAFKLPLLKLPVILMHWQIPEEHMPQFWTLLRRQPACWSEKAMPEAVTFEDFEAVLLKFLRRVRDKYCGVRVDKCHFVARNTLRFEEEYSVRGQRVVADKCFQVVHRRSKLKRMCKMVPKVNSQVPVEEIVEELNTMKSLDHPNIVRLFEWFETDDSFMLIMEAARGGDLGRLLTKARNAGLPGIEERLAQSVTLQALRAIDYIHTRRILHRDIKPTNMLLLVAPERELPRLLLADFGIAELFMESAPSCGSSSVRGTLGYLAPEVFDGSTVGPQVDIWSLGIVVFEILCGQRPFAGDNLMTMYASLQKSLSFEPFDEIEVSEDAIAFLSRVLAKDVHVRPSASEALADAWFEEYPLPSSPARLATESELKESVTSYMKSSYFSKVVLNSVASQLDAAKLEGLTQVFEAFDTDGNGWISREELAAGLPGISKLELEYFAEELDANGNNQIDYSEFVACLLQTKRKLIEDVLHHSFSTFDVNNDGEISVDELRQVLVGNRSLSSVLPDGLSVEDVIAEIDVTGRGAISFAEFRAHVLGESASKLESEKADLDCCETQSEKSAKSASANASTVDTEEKGSRRQQVEDARQAREKARAAAEALHQDLRPLAAKSSRLSSLLSKEEALWSQMAELQDEVASLLEEEPEIALSTAVDELEDRCAKPIVAGPVAPLALPCKVPSASNAMNRTTGNRWHVLSFAKPCPPQMPRQGMSRPRSSFRRHRKLPPLQLHGVFP